MSRCNPQEQGACDARQEPHLPLTLLLIPPAQRKTQATPDYGTFTSFFSAAFLRSSFAMIATSTRRFCCLPSGVELVATGCVKPYPFTLNREGSTPRLSAKVATDRARRSDSF